MRRVLDVLLQSRSAWRFRLLRGKLFWQESFRLLNSSKRVDGNDKALMATLSVSGQTLVRFRSLGRNGTPIAGNIRWRALPWGWRYFIRTGPIHNLEV